MKLVQLLLDLISVRRPPPMHPRDVRAMHVRAELVRQAKENADAALERRVRAIELQRDVMSRRRPT